MPREGSKTPPSTFNVGPHPGPSSPAISRRMAHLARRDNDSERSLRSALHARGMRFRVTYKVPGLPRRTIDIAFTKAKVAVFVDGCLWHGCPHHGTAPRSNAAWWTEKISVNRARDADTTRHLEALGWRVIRIWEHIPLDEAVAAIENVVRPRSPRNTP